jgi:hypothetical protein
MGNGWRFASSAWSVIEDSWRGSLEDIEEKDLANRTSEMISTQLHKVLKLFASKNTKITFSPFLCTNTVHALDQEGLRNHIISVKEQVLDPDDRYWVFPIWIEAAASHMTAIIAHNGVTEYYDSLGVSMNKYVWYDDIKVLRVASIISEVLFPNSKPELLENHNPHQGDNYMCGLFVAAWIDYRVNQNKTQEEWMAKLKETEDVTIRRQVAKLVREAKETFQSDTEEVSEGPSGIESFEFDDLDEESAGAETPTQ